MRTASAQWIVGALVLAMAATACGTGEDGRTARTGGRITVVLGEPQHGLVGQETAESEGAEVLHALFTGLVTYDPKTSEPKLAIAESVDTTDSKTWTIRIKDGFTFHNGEKVDAQSFVRAWNWGADQENTAEAMGFFSKIEGSDELAPGKGRTPAAKELRGLRVLDDRTFTVTLKAPFPQFWTMLGYDAFYPLPKAFEADPKGFGEAPVGNGPFRMDGTWEHGKQIKVKKYDKYPAEGRAKLDSVTFKIYDDLDAAYGDLHKNAVQITDKLPVSALDTVAEEFGDRYVYKPEASVGYLGLPLEANPEAFGKVEIRRAISMAIDREAISKKVFQGTRKPADDFISPIVPGYRRGALGEAGLYDPVKAKALFEHAGGIPGNELELGYNEDGGHKEWIEAVAAQLRANLGLEVTAKPYPSSGALIDDVKSQKFKGAFRMGWAMDYPAAENYLRPVFSKEAIANGSNFGRYGNDEFEAVLAAADRATDPAESLTLYQQADDIVIRDLPYIPLFTYMSSVAYSKAVKNVRVDAQGRIDLAHVELD
ncbi:ABC transporter substrate-binding protein [Streptomyces vinaceus]|uniref:ABC transporter substrate-binding protein n=1 Tax=Streptomyces vinaceus TaxID=1960 RepID=A0A5J6J4F6_STRVI|nr:ABC transporter substrate-binding protein [Streptomyces vinaceus]QEV45720.1 ABC transporter substrate-binding protein [Streptomyces vinaceus]GHE32920.1 peptide ABC transporter substrate-binding protein [Streptomyces vinaceus]